MAVACCASGALHGQTVAAGDELDLLAQEHLVYSAARYVQTLAETPANVSIISADDIRRYGYRSVSDARRALPGVYDAASQWPALGGKRHRGAGRLRLTRAVPDQRNACLRADLRRFFSRLSGY